MEKFRTFSIGIRLYRCFKFCAFHASNEEALADDEEDEEYEAPRNDDDDDGAKRRKFFIISVFFFSSASFGISRALLPLGRRPKSFTRSKSPPIVAALEVEAEQLLKEEDCCERARASLLAAALLDEENNVDIFPSSR
jgi:hypothetical protein